MYSTSGRRRASSAASSALSRVYSRFDPGGVSSEMMNSARSSSGKKPDSTFPHAGMTPGTSRPGSLKKATMPTAASTQRCQERKRRYVTAKTISASAAKVRSSPGKPAAGSVNEAKNVPTASATIAVRWSSAHAITFL